ncbi:MAG: hypothetical protein DLM53_06625 [Candidatus Eremiobacter antarcticus]|nr:DegV family protein [Candidatus Eremiobacteraeota bacterium]MBC5808656.1 DegV family protein [Candidatus Eremiobacteraeota bacterium]PZR62145.1 MAG: hypothetical protein DLM53_06625 [Candidatus Eremiobacter sp. RRmetagenome_bin22]
MGGVAIVTDSSADLGTLAAENGVTTVPLGVRFGSDQFLDGVDLTPEEFYRRLEHDAHPPTTSQPPPAAFAAVYKSLLDAGADSIVSLHLSAALSGTYGSALIAAKEVDEGSISVIDTRSVSLGLGLLALEAARSARSGASRSAVCDQVRSDSLRVELYATVPSLTYIARGGRIGQLRGLLGNVLRIVPIITLQDGEVAEYGKVRTFARAVDRLVQIAISRIASKGTARFAVLHAVAPDVAGSIAQRIRNALEPAMLVVASVGPTVGTHAGPGAVGIIFLP